MSFEELGISKGIADALRRINVVEPTDVQRESIPVILTGKDVIVRAKTGTGKTIAFLAPGIQLTSKHHEYRQPHILVLAPTRELAVQIAGVASRITDRRRVATIYGGASINMQIDTLRRGADIIIGTPGRIIDLIERGALKLGTVEHLIIDEVDIMLDMGFVEDIEYIMDRTPSEKQTIMLSATMPKDILEISKRKMKNHQMISVGDSGEITVKSIKHMYSIARGTQKFHMLLAYIDEYKPKKAIIFLQTKREADILHSFLLEQNQDAILLHGGLTQAKRSKSMSSFRQGSRFLIATNVAARGLDISDITDIINFDIPDSPYVYVHRVGRSARMGKDGRAFSIISNDQIGIVKDIEFEARIKMEKIFLDTKKYEGVRVELRSSRGFSGGREGRFGSSSRQRPEHGHRERSSGGGHWHQNRRRSY